MDKEIIIAQTKKWIVDVVVGCNFCPFAAREIKRNSIHFEVIENATKATVVEKLSATFVTMNTDDNMETAFIILLQNFDSFAAYLKLVNASEALLKKSGYEGIYQVASFHPGYVFAGASLNDPANYTNRSPYPMIHILREDSVSRAVDSYPDTNMIPQKNIAFANSKGLAYMRALREACMRMDN